MLNHSFRNVLPPRSIPAAYYADLWPSIPIFPGFICWAASTLWRRESRSRRSQNAPSAVSDWATAFWKPASLLSLWPVWTPPLAVHWLIFFFWHWPANGGQVWAIWMSQPPPHCVCGGWQPLVCCLSPWERLWKGPPVSCNGRLLSMTHLKFKPPRLPFCASLIPTGHREFWLQIRHTQPTGPIVAPTRPSKRL